MDYFNNYGFSTTDHDVDRSPNNCADSFKCGWWFNYCGTPVNYWTHKNSYTAVEMKLFQKP